MENNKFVLTSDFKNGLKRGLKVRIGDDFKYSVYLIEEDHIILKQYGSQTGGYYIAVGDEVRGFKLGW